MGFDERTFWVYPWDLAEGNPRDQLESIKRLGANAVSIPFSYHSLRALAPHLPGRKVICSEASIYFRRRAGEFPPSGIQPRSSEWATDEGPVANLSSLAEGMDLRIRAWTVVFHNTPLAEAHLDAAIKNCFGDVFVHALCPSAPKSREYALGLVQAISARSIHAIELEAAGFYGYEHLSHHDKCGIAFDLFHHFLFSCCFCTYCRRNFQSAGVDPDFVSRRFCDRLQQFFAAGAPPSSDCEAAATTSLIELLGEDMTTRLLRARSQCVLGLLGEMRTVIPASIELTVLSGLSAFECSALLGANPADTLRIVDRLLLPVFEPNDLRFRKRYESALRCFSDPSRWIAGIRIFPPDASSETEIQSRLEFLRSKGFRAVHLYHYGLAPHYLLEAAGNAWIRR